MFVDSVNSIVYKLKLYVISLVTQIIHIFEYIAMYLYQGLKKYLSGLEI